MKDLYINSAVQIDVAGTPNAVVIHIPYRFRKGYRKIHVRLVRELEKKLSWKVFLDTKERNNTEYKTFAAMYRKLSGKDVVFEFSVTEA